MSKNNINEEPLTEEEEKDLGIVIEIFTEQLREEQEKASASYRSSWSPEDLDIARIDGIDVKQFFRTNRENEVQNRQRLKGRIERLNEAIRDISMNMNAVGTLPFAERKRVLTQFRKYIKWSREKFPHKFEKSFSTTSRTREADDGDHDFT